jgi:hypothetical protein
MGQYGVKVGNDLVWVEAPKGTSDDQIKALALKQKTTGSGLGSSLRGPTAIARQVQPGEQPVDVSMGRYLAEGAKRRSGDILATAGGALMPGSGLLGLAGRLGASEAGQVIGDAATGQKVTPGYGAATQLVGEGVGKVASTLASPKMMQRFADRTVKALASKLDDLVPSWRGLPATARGLWERAHGTGQRVLSRNFDGMIQGIKGQIPETFVITVPEMVEVGGKMFQAKGPPRNARALIDELPDLRKAGGKPYYNTLRALADQLPDGLSPALDAARTEYKAGAGWMDFAERGKFLKHERYDPEKAQEALTTWGKKTLLGRGLDDIAAIVRGPGEKPIESVKHSQFLQRLEGALVGGAAGLPLGIPHAIGGAAGGVVAGGALPRTTYRNVPLTAAERFAGRFGTAGIGEGLRETARDIGLKQQLPGVLPAGQQP